MCSIKEKLAGILELQKDLSAYLFGLKTTESNHSAIDVDVALQFQRSRVLCAVQLLQIQYDLTSVLQKETNLVVLEFCSIEIPSSTNQ